MNANHIEAALFRHHSRDFCLRGVKSGSTWFQKSGQLRILDFWAMRKTWTRYEATGYEIKISRSDFKADHKWEEYLKYCTRFLFACPSGLIKKDELPNDVGLVYITPRLTVHIERHARFIPRFPDADFLRYILMQQINLATPLPCPIPDYAEIAANRLRQGQLNLTEGHTP
jgi:hypothetical protein